MSDLGIQMLHRIESKTGFRTVGLVTPTVSNALLLAIASRATQKDSSRSILFYGPDVLPALYSDKQNWFDDEHLTNAGAVIFSAAFGRDVCVLMQKNGW
jgi:hypothetical protein